MTPSRQPDLTPEPGYFAQDRGEHRYPDRLGYPEPTDRPRRAGTRCHSPPIAANAFTTLSRDRVRSWFFSTGCSTVRRAGRHMVSSPRFATNIVSPVSIHSDMASATNLP